MTNTKNLENIIGLYGSRIHNVIKKFTKVDSDIEDIKQEIYIKTWKNLPVFNGSSVHWGWLNKVAVNTCIDYFRSSKKRQNEIRVDKDVLENIKSNQENTEVKIIFTERHKLILSAIDKLPPKFREVIILHDIEELTYEEISLKIKCPIGTVKSRLFTARKILRENLQDLLT